MDGPATGTASGVGQSLARYMKASTLAWIGGIVSAVAFSVALAAAVSPSSKPEIKKKKTEASLKNSKKSLTKGSSSSHAKTSSKKQSTSRSGNKRIKRRSSVDATVFVAPTPLDIAPSAVDIKKKDSRDLHQEETRSIVETDATSTDQNIEIIDPRYMPDHYDCGRLWPSFQAEREFPCTLAYSVKIDLNSTARSVALVTRTATTVPRSSATSSQDSSSSTRVLYSVDRHSVDGHLRSLDMIAERIFPSDLTFVVAAPKKTGLPRYRQPDFVPLSNDAIPTRGENFPVFSTVVKSIPVETISTPTSIVRAVAELVLPVELCAKVLTSTAAVPAARYLPDPHDFSSNLADLWGERPYPFILAYSATSPLLNAVTAPADSLSVANQTKLVVGVKESSSAEDQRLDECGDSNYLPTQFAVSRHLSDLWAERQYPFALAYSVKSSSVPAVIAPANILSVVKKTEQAVIEELSAEDQQLDGCGDFKFMTDRYDSLNGNRSDLWGERPYPFVLAYSVVEVVSSPADEDSSTLVGSLNSTASAASTSSLKKDPETPVSIQQIDNVDESSATSFSEPCSPEPTTGMVEESDRLSDGSVQDPALNSDDCTNVTIAARSSRNTSRATSPTSTLMGSHSNDLEHPFTARRSSYNLSAEVFVPDLKTKSSSFSLDAAEFVPSARTNSPRSSDGSFHLDATASTFVPMNKEPNFPPQQDSFNLYYGQGPLILQRPLPPPHQAGVHPFTPDEFYNPYAQKSQLGYGTTYYNMEQTGSSSDSFSISPPYSFFNPDLAMLPVQQIEANAHQDEGNSHVMNVPQVGRHHENRQHRSIGRKESRRSLHSTSQQHAAPTLADFFPGNPKSAAASNVSNATATAPATTVPAVAVPTTSSAGRKASPKHSAQPHSKQSAPDQCMFGASCVNSACAYSHPTEYCKFYPECRSGPQCPFIHRPQTQARV